MSENNSWNEKPEGQNESMNPITGQPVKKEDAAFGNPDSQSQYFTENNSQSQAGGSDYDEFYANHGKKQKNKMLAPIIGIVAVAALVAVIFLLKGFKGKSNKGCSEVVASATTNTLTSGKFFENTEKFFSYFDDDCGVDITINSDAFGLTGDLEYNQSKKQAYVNASVNTNGQAIDFTTKLDNESLSLQVPILSEKVYKYNYKKEGTGYLSQIANSYGVKLSDYNKQIENFMSKNNSDLGFNDLKEFSITLVDKLNLKKTDKAKYTINGKEQECQGYTGLITSEYLEDVIDSYADYIEKATKVTGQNPFDNMGEDPFKDARESVKDSDDLDITFYLYDDRLVAIKLVDNKNSSNNIEIQFNGGAYILENYKISISSEGEVGTLEKCGSTVGSKETATYKIDGVEFMNTSYDSESGEYSLVALDDYDQTKIAGILIVDDSGATFTIDEIVSPSTTERVSVSFNVNKNSNVPDSLSGTEVDLNNLSAQDFAQELTEISTKIQQLDSLFGSSMY